MPPTAPPAKIAIDASAPWSRPTSVAIRRPCGESLTPELHRRFASFGFRSDIDADGITRLPVPRDICVKYSRAHAAIAKMAADMGAMAISLQNGRECTRLNLSTGSMTVLARRSVLRGVDWQQLPSAEEKAHLAELLVNHKIRSIPLEQPPASRAKDSLPVIPPPRFGPGKIQTRENCLLTHSHG